VNKIIILLLHIIADHIYDEIDNDNEGYVIDYLLNEPYLKRKKNCAIIIAAVSFSQQFFLILRILMNWIIIFILKYRDVNSFSE